MRRSRFLNRWAVMLFAGIGLLLVAIFKVPQYQKQQRLLALGYTEEEVSLLAQKKIANEVLRQEIYSPSLVVAAQKEDFQKKYFHLYIGRDNVQKEDIALYELLKSAKAYNDEELVRLFTELKNFALRPLILFDKVEVEEYIADNAKFPDNHEKKFVLSGDYLHPYENVQEVVDKESEEAFVSSKYTIGQYAPSKLVSIPIMYSIEGMQLRSDALQAFTDMCDKLASEVEGEGIYAIGAYVSYDQQKMNYDDYGLEADKYLLRPGFDDAQLGLSVRVKSSARDISFAQTKSYEWLEKNAALFGFIERYPLGKEELTLHKADPTYWRFVGIDLAKRIKDSGLSFDEYYALQLAQQAEKH